MGRTGSTIPAKTPRSRISASAAVWMDVSSGAIERPGKGVWISAIAVAGAMNELVTLGQEPASEQRAGMSGIHFDETPSLDRLPAAVFDELSLWSAPFGLRLLEAVDLRPDLEALDVGCGTGFPLLELAQRLGPAARVHGVDPWRSALDRAREKLDVYGADNVVLHLARAEQLPLEDRSVDLIVSNNGLNNVDDLEAAVAECARVARPGAQLVYAYNLPGSMLELYEVYDALLSEHGLEAERQALAAHILAKRKPLAFMIGLFERAGFRVERVIEDSFRLRFAGSRAMFAHFFIRVAFLPSWLEIVGKDRQETLFTELGRRLDAGARVPGCLELTIPLACLDCRRS
jgi:SAM-dependent methyltransferase